MTHSHGDDGFKKSSISLGGAVGMGTGVMIGAGIFALTGQIAQLAGPYFALSFVLGAIATSFSAYSYIKMSNAWPSSGGIAMILQKAYGPGAVAAAAALLMALSMVISESLVAWTFATYVLRPFDITGGPLVPILAVGVILFAYLVNITGNRSVGFLSIIMAVIKIGGIALFGIIALWSGGFSFPDASTSAGGPNVTGFVASVALSILAFKGFTTITNSGAEITNPHRNVGRTIMISLAVCVVIYLLVSLAVGAILDASAPVLGVHGFAFPECRNREAEISRCTGDNPVHMATNTATSHRKSELATVRFLGQKIKASAPQPADRQFFQLVANGEDAQNLTVEVAAIIFGRVGKLELQSPFAGNAKAGCPEIRARRRGIPFIDQNRINVFIDLIGDGF
jgi:amino acid transporter